VGERRRLGAVERRAADRLVRGVVVAAVAAAGGSRDRGAAEAQRRDGRHGEEHALELVGHPIASVRFESVVARPYAHRMR
jgi:hypothetical protein